MFCSENSKQLLYWMKLNFDLFEDQDVNDAIDEEESTHGDVLPVQKESVLRPPPS